MISSRLPPLNTLRAFEAAARHGSFVKASAELHVTPAAVSQRIKDLESSLDVALFRRLPRGVELTEAGRRYRDELTRAFGIIERATAQIDQATVDGPLIVSLPESFAQYWLAPRLPRLAARIPGLELTLESESRLVDLRDGQADVGVRFGMGEYAGLDSQWLFGDTATVLVSAGCMPELSDARAKTVLQNSVLLEDYRRQEQSQGPRVPKLADRGDLDLR